MCEFFLNHFDGPDIDFIFANKPKNRQQQHSNGHTKKKRFRFSLERINSKSVTILWIEQRKIDLKTIFECAGVLFSRLICKNWWRDADWKFLFKKKTKQKNYRVYDFNCVNHLHWPIRHVEKNQNNAFYDQIVWIWCFHFTEQNWMDIESNAIAAQVLKSNVFFSLSQYDWPCMV